MADDRPKKSWREIDRAKDKSRATGEPRNFDDRKGYMDGKSQAMDKYKSNLDALFGGGAALPEALRAKLGLAPESEESKARKKAIEELAKTPTAKVIAAFIVSGHEWPNDPRILMGCLGVTDETLLKPILAALIVAIRGGQQVNKMLLIQKVQNLKMRVREPETLELLKQVSACCG